MTLTRTIITEPGIREMVALAGIFWGAFAAIVYAILGKVNAALMMLSLSAIALIIACLTT